MKWIDYEAPTSVREAVDLLNEAGDNARPLAGGTDLLVQMRGRAYDLDLVVDVKNIPELNELTYDPDNGLTIGAAVPCYRIYGNSTVRSVYPGIVVLVAVHFPTPAANSGANYIRFIPRNEMDIAVAGAGVSVELENGNIKSARVTLASVAPTPLFVSEAGDAVAGKPATEETVRIASGLARDAAVPITDMRGTIEYRKHLCEVLTRRAMMTAIERAQS